MPDTKNADQASSFIEIIDQQIPAQTWHDPFPSASIPSPALFREVGEIVGSRTDRRCDRARCCRIVRSDVCGNGLKIADRLAGPDYLQGSGGGSSFGVPQLSSHRHTSAWLTVRPVARSARASAIA